MMLERSVLFSFIVLVVACRGESAPAAPRAASSSAAPAISASPVASAAATASAPSTPSTPSTSVVPSAVTFDADPEGTPPRAFSFARTGQGAEGKWIVRAEADAPSAKNVLAQLDADKTDYRFPVAVADAPVARDVDASVRCKPVSGSVDRACGLVFRFKSESDYYVTRANALENNVRLYYVKAGKRVQIATFSGPVASGKWHELRAVARGDALTVYFDGAKVIEHRDSTFPDAGKVGVWTKADSVTYFDDLRVTSLDDEKNSR